MKSTWLLNLHSADNKTKHEASYMSAYLYYIPQKYF